MGHGFFQRGGGWVLAQFVLLALVIAGGIIWRHQFNSAPITAAGAGLLLMGAALGIAGTMALRRNLTPFPQPSPNTRIVQKGIYGLVRHPIYTAVMCACLGWAVLMGSWPAMVCAFLTALFLDRKAQVEERALRSRFAEYAEYERRVKRFVPWIY